MTQAIGPLILARRSIICIRMLAIGLLARVRKVGEWSGAARHAGACNHASVGRVSSAIARRRCRGGACDAAFVRRWRNRRWRRSRTKQIAMKHQEVLESDASSFTFAVRTAEKYRMIFESGFTNIKIGKESAKQSFPESLFRYGLTDRLELRFGYNYETSPTNRDAIEGDIAGNFGIICATADLLWLQVPGERQREENPWRPTSAFLFQLHMLIESEQTRTQIRLGYAFWMGHYQTAGTSMRVSATERIGNWATTIRSGPPRPR